MASQSGLSTPKSARPQSSSKPSHSNSSTTSRVRVVVRVRPFLPSEIQAKDGNPIACASALNPDSQSDTNEVAVHLKDQETSRNECYKLDSFFGQDDSVNQIFKKEVNPLIPWIFRGRNATVFAYGATGSGKTHTIQGTNEMPGLMSLAMSTIFPMCEIAGSVTEISYYEIYMDRCYDLLEPKTEEIKVLDDKDGQAQLRGLSRVAVTSMDEFHQVLSRGIQRRRVAHTGLNDVSSRSHGVLVIAVSNVSGDGSKSVVMGKLNLIDLAGNEDNRRSCSEGIRLQESAKINQSLFTLSNVIYALNNTKARVPYRESKLTRILQDSLGGTSRALMVACLNPGEYQESVYTVSLASRSRYIANCASAQTIETPKVKMEARLRTWLETKEKTKSAQKVGGFGSPSFSRTPISVSSVKKKKILYKSSGKKEAPTTNQAASHKKERNRLNHGAQVVSLMEDMSLDKVEEHEDSLGNLQNEGCTESTDNSVFLPCDEDHFGSYNEASNDLAVEDKKESSSFTVWANVLYSAANIPEKCLENENADSSCYSPEPTVTSEMVKEVQTPFRTALSPINSNSNMKLVEDVQSKDQLCTHQFELKTPRTPHVHSRDDDEFQFTTTPLSKFNSRTSNLKNTLVQEYLAVLNSASKEELMGLKGIGQKRAEYILELRETSPLESLSDLEKIGLSSKQVNGMFRKTAGGIFS